MARTKTITLAALVVALVAALALVAGCSAGGGSSSAGSASSAAAPQKTLETYVKANQSEWDSVVAQLKESGGDVMDVDMSVSGNTITQIMTYKQTFTSEQVAIIKSNLEGQSGEMLANVADQIAEMEKASDVSGIEWVFEYRNGDGQTISAFTATAKKS